VADYSVDIAIAVKGAKELKAARAETTALSKEITTLNKLANKKSKTLPNSFKTLNQVLSQSKGNLNKVAIGTERYFKAIGDVIDKEQRLNKAYSRQKIEFRAIQNLKKKGIQINRQNIQLIRNEIAAELKLARAKRQTGKASIGKGIAGKIGGTASSAIIGGAFPLLFGQTGAAAVGGGLGGAAGGLIGGQFGFALSILGTAIGSAIDKNQKFNESLGALNVKFTSVSSSAQLTSKDIDEVAKRMRITKEEAFAVLGAFSEFGSGSIAKSLTSIFGSDSSAFQGIATANRQAKLANQIFEARKQIGVQRAIELQQQNLSNNAGVVELALAEARAKAENDIAVAKAKQITFLDRLAASEDAITGQEGGAARFGIERARKIQEKFDNEKLERQKNFTEALRQFRELLGLTNEAQGQFGQSGVLAFSAITDKVKDLQDEMKKLTNPIFQVITLSETMARSFEDSFVGIIRGTMSVGDAFRNMLNAMADHFIKTAARMMANQFQQGLLSLVGQGLGSAFSFGSSFKNFGSTSVGTSSQFVGSVKGFPTFADGGRPPVGRASIVGERGPELFVPDRAGTIVPNNAMGGSTNIVINVDASGSSVEGDEEQANAFGSAIATAIQSELIKQKRPGGLLA